MAEKRGKFITFEGGEGAGKSTQARMLKAALEARGREVVDTREPGGTPGAEEIRKLLVEGAPERWTAASETLLFLAARADHIARLIEPALAAGKWVISDRFSDSTIVYQGIARGLGLESVQRLSAAALGKFVPDLTLVLDVDPKAGLSRAGKRGANENRFERFGESFHMELRHGFREIAAAEPKRCALIDGEGSPEDVAASVWRVVEERLRP
jgi:dTMP kinase